MSKEIQKIKQDINFLNEPLWLVNLKQDNKGFSWIDKDHYTFSSKYKAPDKIDILILLYLMLESQKCNNREINTTKHQILRNCNLATSKQYYDRVEESLKRWLGVNILFKGSFYNDGHYISEGFHIVESYKIDTNARNVNVVLNKKWMDRIKESNYYRYIDFDYYTALKRPVSRRLFELLIKENTTCKYKLIRLGEKLTLQGTGRGGKLWASEVLAKVKAAINEIDKVAKESGYKLFTVTYIVEGVKSNRVIHFTKGNIKQLVPVQGVNLDLTNKQVDELYNLAKEQNEAIKGYIADSLESSGFEYVSDNIKYANGNAKANYQAYLHKSLLYNWAAEFAEKERIKEQARLEAEQARIEADKEEQAKQMLEKELREQRIQFELDVMRFPVEARKALIFKAEKEVAKNVHGRKTHLAINCVESLIISFNLHNGFKTHTAKGYSGMVYSKDIVQDLQFVRDIFKLLVKS